MIRNCIVVIFATLCTCSSSTEQKLQRLADDKVTSESDLFQMRQGGKPDGRDRPVSPRMAAFMKEIQKRCVAERLLRLP